eukprot:5157962-Pleurochrysis_carterae.AAC.1
MRAATCSLSEASSECSRARSSDSTRSSSRTNASSDGSVELLALADSAERAKLICFGAAFAHDALAVRSFLAMDGFVDVSV